MVYLKEKGVMPASNSMGDIYEAMNEVFFMMNTNLIPNTEKGNKAFAKWAASTTFMSSEFFDANGNLRDMSEISVVLNEATKNLTEEQKNEAMATIFGSDAMRAAAGIADSGAVAYRTASEAAKALGVSIDDAAKFAEGGSPNSRRWNYLSLRSTLKSKPQPA